MPDPGTDVIYVWKTGHKIWRYKANQLKTKTSTVIQECMWIIGAQELKQTPNMKFLFFCNDDGLWESNLQ